MKLIPKNKINNQFGFSLVELLVVISIIGILSGIVYASFGDARAAARDDIRKSDLKQLQLAVEAYRAQYGRYPTTDMTDSNCYPTSTEFSNFSCENYIVGIVPDFISQLPRNPNGDSYLYRTNSDGTSYKILADGVEVKIITSETDEFSPCPTFYSSGSFAAAGISCTEANTENTYGVYGGPDAAPWYNK